MTMKKHLLASLFLAASALAPAACGPVVPANPTWAEDIRPLMVARCIRCHDGTGHVDPATTMSTQVLSAALVAYNFNYATLPDPLGGLATLRTLGPKSVRGPIAGGPRMPPPPAEKLEDWEIQLLDNWAAENPPR
jgi:hypothetical protein